MEVTATPIISKMIPIIINNTRIIIPIARFTLDKVSSDIREKIKDIRKANNVIVMIQGLLLFFFFVIISPFNK